MACLFQLMAWLQGCHVGLLPARNASRGGRQPGGKGAIDLSPQIRDARRATLPPPPDQGDSSRPGPEPLS